MTDASAEDIEILRKYFSGTALKAALDDPAPGIFDQSSWVKWNEHYCCTPVPPLPMRRIPGVARICFPPNLETRNVSIPTNLRRERTGRKALDLVTIR
jgi:hypothetical protein